MDYDTFMTGLLTFLAIYSVVLAIVGTLGNTFSAVVCLRKHLRKTPTFIFQAFALIADIVCLFIWNIDHYLVAYLNTQIAFFGIEICRLSMFVQCFSLQFSAFVLTFLSIESYMSVKIKKWRNVHFKPKRAYILLLILAAVLLVFNGIFVNFIDVDPNNTNSTCYDSKIMVRFLQANIVIYGLIPYTITMVANILLAKTVLSKNIVRNEESQSKRRSLSISVLFVTTAFIILTLPFNVVNAFFFEYLAVQDHGFTIVFIFDCLAFSYHGLHFVILAVTNKQFMREAKALIRRLRYPNQVTFIDSSTHAGSGSTRLGIKSIWDK